MSVESFVGRRDAHTAVPASQPPHRRPTRPGMPAATGGLEARTAANGQHGCNGEGPVLARLDVSRRTQLLGNRQPMPHEHRVTGALEPATTATTGTALEQELLPIGAIVITGKRLQS